MTTGELTLKFGFVGIATAAEPVGAGLLVATGAGVVVAKVEFESTAPALPLRQSIEASTTAPTKTRAMMMKGRYRFIEFVFDVPSVMAKSWRGGRFVAIVDNTSSFADRVGGGGFAGGMISVAGSSLSRAHMEQIVESRRQGRRLLFHRHKCDYIWDNVSRYSLRVHATWGISRYSNSGKRIIRAQSLKQLRPYESEVSSFDRDAARQRHRAYRNCR
jgi:hypothetical protein